MQLGDHHQGRANFIFFNAEKASVKASIVKTENSKKKNFIHFCD